MVNFYESNYTFSYSFPAVSLAYFLRYPNPYSTHVLSTDVIDRHFDPSTGRLHTTRLHLKKSKVPAAVARLVPKGFFGNGEQTQSFILEKSVVDVKEGWMETESRNLDHTGVLSVIEKQVYRRPADSGTFRDCKNAAAAHGLIEANAEEYTDVTTTVTLLSRFGQAVRRRRKAAEEAAKNQAVVEEEPKQSWLRTYSNMGIQRSIELIGLKRTQRSQPNAKEGMKIVLQRLRHGGLVEVLEGMRRDRELAHGITGGLKQLQGRNPNDDAD